MGIDVLGARSSTRLNVAKARAAALRSYRHSLDSQTKQCTRLLQTKKKIELLSVINLSIDPFLDIG
jgi:hypothetical protein